MAGAPIPFSRPTIEEDEIAEVVDSLRSGWITSGPKVQKFEAQFVERLGVRHAVAVNSATAGLHLAVALLDLEPGDEVIVPTLTWASTANVVELLGAKPVFADVDPGTLCVDPDDVKKRITPRTRALIPVHYAGQPADLGALRALARDHDLTLIHDAAHALGTKYGDEEIGASGELTVFSFHPIKNITTGEGGMITLADEAQAERLRLLRFHGVSKNAWKRYQSGGKPRYSVVEPGWKYNMLDLQAALGIHQLEKLERFNARRRELAERYTSALANIPGIEPLAITPYPSEHAWHLYIVQLELERLNLDRDGVMSALEEEQVGCGLHFPALHTDGFYPEKYGAMSLPNAERAAERILSLPLYPLLSEADQDRVVAAIERVLAAHQE